MGEDGEDNTDVNGGMGNGEERGKRKEGRERNSDKLMYNWYRCRVYDIIEWPESIICPIIAIFFL